MYACKVESVRTFPCAMSPAYSNRSIPRPYTGIYDCKLGSAYLAVSSVIQPLFKAYDIGFTTGYPSADWSVLFSVVPHIDLPSHVRCAHIENTLRDRCHRTTRSPCKGYEWSDIEMSEVFHGVAELIVVDSFFRLR